MVLRIVRYLGQQGYDTDRLVILTPYLGQLRAIMDALKEVHRGGAALSDLDSRDLVRAGLISGSNAKSVKKQIRIATIGMSSCPAKTVFYAKRFIDNYQGEESDIVIASLTRSNHSHDIGFMSSPERLNVLLSRARDGLIMIGNVQTFTNARKGAELWIKLVEHLKKHGNIYDGLPIICEQHPDQRSLLKTPADFDTECPEGGCSRPWYALLSSHLSEYQLTLGYSGALLNCKMHHCPSKCHRLPDHSRVRCEAFLVRPVRERPYSEMEVPRRSAWHLPKVRASTESRRGGPPPAYSPPPRAPHSSNQPLERGVSTRPHRHLSKHRE